MQNATGSDVRLAARRGDWTGPTPGLARGYVQANLVILPRDLSEDFSLFCARNPRPCPVLDVTEPGSPEPRRVAPGADVRTDVPAYCIYRGGQLVDTPKDVLALWRDDLVAFLLGCSFTFENALLDANLPVRHVERGCNVPMYRTNRPCAPAGAFHGPLVVSMRPMQPHHAEAAAAISARYPLAHGAPIHIGDPLELGITDLARPDYGDPVPVHAGEVPVFWACGVTPQAAVAAARPPFVITHKPGHMFVTDWRDEQLLVKN